MYLASPRRFAQVSSLKSQVSTPSGLPKSQVSSLKYLSVFFIFFSFHDKSNCVCCTSYMFMYSAVHVPVLTSG